MLVIKYWWVPAPLICYLLLILHVVYTISHIWMLFLFFVGFLTFFRPTGMWYDNFSTMSFVLPQRGVSCFQKYYLHVLFPYLLSSYGHWIFCYLFFLVLKRYNVSLFLWVCGGMCVDGCVRMCVHALSPLYFRKINIMWLTSLRIHQKRWKYVRKATARTNAQIRYGLQWSWPPFVT